MSIRDLIPWSRGRKVPVRYEENPFATLQREINRLFENFFHSFDLEPFRGFDVPSIGFVPKVDVIENDKEVRISAELPGMDENDIDVSVTDDLLTIKGEKKEEKEYKEGHVYRTECSYGRFERVIPLPSEVEVDKADATFKKGVLTIVLPKKPESESGRKRITVKSE